MTALLRSMSTVCIRVCLVLMAGWATLAILYSNLPNVIKPWAAGIFAVGSLLALIGNRP